MESDTYANLAKYYDAAYRVKEGPNLKDVPFYLEQARQNGGPILEMACGTGRVLIEIARIGIEIVGVDLSTDMLSILRTKLTNESDEVQRRVSLREGDMRSVSLGRQFKQIFLPFRPLQALHTIEDQIAALRCLSAHMQPDGHLAFDVFYPKFRGLEADMTDEVLDAEWVDSKYPQRTIRRYFMRHRVNPLHQYFEGEFIFRTYEEDQLILEERSPLKMTYYTYPHLLLLFKHCGLEIIEEYGSFDKDPIDICNEMIFVLRKMV